MDYGASYEPEFRVHAVNGSTWADGPQVGRVVEAAVENVSDGLLQSGTMSATVDGGFEAGYYRIVMAAEQAGAVEREEIATLLCSSAGGEVDHGVDTIDIEGRSVLYSASVRKLLAGAYAPKGADGAQYAASLLRECVAAPVEVVGSFALGSHIVFDLGTSCLDAAWAVLKAGNYTMQVNGHGTVRVMPMPTEPALDLDAAGARLLLPGIGYKLDYSSVPNVYRADDGTLTATAANDDPSSPTSTVSRGYEHDVVDKSPKPLAGETLAAYAVRKLMEASVVEETRDYEREYAPGVLPGCIARGSVEGLRGDFRITRQSLAVKGGITVKETASREVRTWDAA